jgi:8-oxo-dGTP diphosphatase
VPDWEEFLVWDDPVYRMHALRAFHPAARSARTAEDQEVFLAGTAALPAALIDNLRWLIPLALDRDVAVPVRVASAAPGGSGLTEPVPEPGATPAPRSVPTAAPAPALHGGSTPSASPAPRP